MPEQGEQHERSERDFAQRIRQATLDDWMNGRLDAIIDEATRHSIATGRPMGNLADLFDERSAAHEAAYADLWVSA
jgi:hypothetical protein